MISKLKAQYFVRGDFQKRISLEPLNSYFPLVKWETVMLVFILCCSLSLQSQIIYLTNSFAQADIPGREPVFIELTRYSNSYGLQLDVFLSLKKSLYGQAEAARLWYEKL